MTIAAQLPESEQRHLLEVARAAARSLAAANNMPRVWLLLAPGGEMVMRQCTVDCLACLPESCPKLQADAQLVPVNIIGRER